MTSTLPALRDAVESFTRVRLQDTVPETLLASVEQALGRKLPPAYRLFLTRLSNGAELDGFRLLPVCDPAAGRAEARRNWDSLQRNNDAATAPWFDRDPASFAHFCVFATLGAACFALPYDSQEETVWLWEAGEDTVVELDYSLAEWLEESARHGE
jgi:hypothetical protein